MIQVPDAPLPAAEVAVVSYVRLRDHLPSDGLMKGYMLQECRVGLISE